MRVKTSESRIMPSKTPYQVAPPSSLRQARSQVPAITRCASGPTSRLVTLCTSGSCAVSRCQLSAPSLDFQTPESVPA